MKSKSVVRPRDDYSKFVDHPRYGHQPRVTGLNPDTNYADVFLHWHSGKEYRIPNTAIPADLSRQAKATVPVTHYFDVRRQCRDCGRPFIFFAEEQKYWYEELKFKLDATLENTLHQRAILQNFMCCLNEIHQHIGEITKIEIVPK